MEKEKVQFKDAVVALEKGRRITKASWGEPEMFVFKQVPSKISITTVPLMQSIPESVKREFLRRFNTEETDVTVYGSIRYEDQFCLVSPENVIYSFSPTTSDVLSNDWIVLDTDLGPEDIRRKDTDDRHTPGNLSIGEALKALVDGARIFRAGWKSERTYLYHVPSRSYPSITPSAKEEFGNSTPYQEYIGIKTPENDVAIWSPTSTDVLANDWRLYTN